MTWDGIVISLLLFMIWRAITDLEFVEVTDD